jgi:hypothetical protein
MSDSLNATVIVSVLVLTISANPELEPLDEEDPEPPRLPAVAAPLAPLPEPELEDVDELLEELSEEPPLDTASPGVRLDSDAIVPLVGAYSLVLLTAVSAVCMAAWALYTAAWAEARLDGDGVLVVVVVGVFVVFAVLEPLPEPDFDRDPDPEPLPLPLDPVVVGWLELGPMVVTVLIVVIVVVVPDPDPFFGFFVLPEPDFDPGSYDANSTVPALPPVRLVSLVEPDPEDPDPDAAEAPDPDPPPDPQFAVD